MEFESDVKSGLSDGDAATKRRGIAGIFRFVLRDLDTRSAVVYSVDLERAESQRLMISAVVDYWRNYRQ